MFLSVFDIFKIGIGPSSSHTVGPMVAARRFLAELPDNILAAATRIEVHLLGSLALTGKGHATDRAVFLGLLGEIPDSVDPDKVDALIAELEKSKKLAFGGREIAFDPAKNLVFDYEIRDQSHPNEMIFRCFGADNNILVETIFCSIGGGFIATPEELRLTDTEPKTAKSESDEPFPFANADTMLAMGQAAGKSIAHMKRENENFANPDQDLDAGLDKIWQAMESCMERGLSRSGELPGGLKVKRRASDIHKKLQAEIGTNQPFDHTVMDWLGVYAMAVNEENAAGGRVVTAPTNGAAGVIPAVIRYYQDHCNESCVDGTRTFLLTSAAIGGIIKHNASISGAEVGCQGEVGAASAMAAAGLCAALGGTNEQIENAAEIALEHHLGMTCDPVGGLVQVPCIERNALGTVKAVTAASLALRGDGTHFVPLDKCIETMRQTGLDMSDKYKETSKGGLAVSMVAC
ncbi:MAG: L-serine ammonia-lyase [Rhizobiales bacterium]|nr:L-serine ammonia-lyase [Hyphomicrobiales bacterium]